MVSLEDMLNLNLLLLVVKSTEKVKIHIPRHSMTLTVTSTRDTTTEMDMITDAATVVHTVSQNQSIDQNQCTKSQNQFINDQSQCTVSLHVTMTMSQFIVSHFTTVPAVQATTNSTIHQSPMVRAFLTVTSGIKSAASTNGMKSGTKLSTRKGSRLKQS